MTIAREYLGTKSPDVLRTHNVKTVFGVVWEDGEYEIELFQPLDSDDTGTYVGISHDAVGLVTWSRFNSFGQAERWLYSEWPNGVIWGEWSE